MKGTVAKPNPAKPGNDIPAAVYVGAPEDEEAEEEEFNFAAYMYEEE